MDRGAQWATAHGVTKSQTTERLSTAQVICRPGSGGGGVRGNPGSSGPAYPKVRSWDCAGNGVQLGGRAGEVVSGCSSGSPGVFIGTALLVLLYTWRLLSMEEKGCALKTKSQTPMGVEQ